MVERGKAAYARDCASCHGADARGAAAPDLIRSLAVLHDRGQGLEGANYAEILKTVPHHFDYHQKDLRELSQFLIDSVNGTLRSGPSNRPTNMLAGDAKAGEGFFKKNCASCHSATGDMAGIGKRFDPVSLQQRFVFPNRVVGGMKKKTQVTVTVGSAKPVTGTLVRIDDFNVTMRLASGDQKTFARGNGVRVRVDDPLDGHYKLLDLYTNDDIHNMTTFLETLK
jgi:cytochrome c2